MSDKEQDKKTPVIPIHTDTKPRSEQEVEAAREKALDKTLADSFPTSDPPSSIPNPATDDSNAA
jgi:hypothetical protein